MPNLTQLAQEALKLARLADFLKECGIEGLTAEQLKFLSDSLEI